MISVIKAKNFKRQSAVATKSKKKVLQARKKMVNTKLWSEIYTGIAQANLGYR